MSVGAIVMEGGTSESTCRLWVGNAPYITCSVEQVVPLLVGEMAPGAWHCSIMAGTTLVKIDSVSVVLSVLGKTRRET